MVSPAIFRRRRRSGGALVFGIGGSLSGGAGALVSDSFDRANAGALGTSDSGHLWTEYGTGDWAINTNQAAFSGGASDNPVTVDAGTADVDIRCTLTVIEAVSDATGLSGRVTAANAWLRLVHADDVVYLQKNDAGSISTLGSGAFIRANGTILRLVCSGNTLTGYANSTQIASVTDAFNNTTTNHGLSGHGTTSRWNDFVIYAP